MKRVLIAIVIVLLAPVIAVGVLFAPLLIGIEPMPEEWEMNGVRLLQDPFGPVSVLVSVVDIGNGEVVLSQDLILGSQLLNSCFAGLKFRFECVKLRLQCSQSSTACSLFAVQGCARSLF